MYTIDNISICRIFLTCALITTLQGLLTAKIDQKNERLRILSCSGRDITPADLSSMLESMSNWCVLVLVLVLVLVIVDVLHTAH